MTQRDPLVYRGQLRAAAAAVTLGLAIPSLVTVVLTPGVAEAKRKKKKKTESTGAPVSKDETDLGDKREYGAPEVVKEKEREKVVVSDKPTLTFEDFRKKKELEKKEKIDEQLRYIDKILSMEPSDSEMPSLLFQKGELFLELSEFYFFEGMGLDEQIVAARDKGQKGKQRRLEQEKKKKLTESNKHKAEGVKIYKNIATRYKKFDRLADVIFSLAQTYWDSDAKDWAIKYYRQLITDYPKSQYVADSWLAFGEWYFSQKDVNRALEAYKRTAEFEESKVFAYAVYKQGWCYYNLGKFEDAGEKFKEVILYSELNPDLLGDRRITLGREARKDFVLTYSHYGDPRRASAEFKELAPDDKEHQQMVNRLADIYFGEGKDREAIVMYRTIMAMRPDDTRNPFFQARIVTCANRINDRRFVVKMARQLVDEFKKVRTFAKQHANDPKIDKTKLENDLIDAEDLADNTLRSLATTWHNEARKTKSDETFELAYELYGDYLELFPDKKPAYEIRFFYAELLYHLERFEKAGEEYTKVLLQDPKGKWSSASAEEAVRAYDEAVADYDRKNKRKPTTGDAALKPQPIPKIKKKLIAASANYLKYYPEGTIAVESKYKVAKILYDYNHFDQAAERFLEITQTHPDHQRAEHAANLTLDIYNLREEWLKLNNAARGFAKNRTMMKNDKFRAVLMEILETSSFKLVADIEAAGNNDEAAKKYLEFVDEFPKSDLSDKAMVNAAINLLKAGRAEESIQIRKKFVAAYPESPLVPDSMYAIAESYEQVVDYVNAADWLERFVAKYPKDDRSKDALYNASIYREGLGQYKDAIKTREDFLKKYSDADDISTIFLSQAGIFKAMGDHQKASEIYLHWAKKYAKTKDEEFDAKFKAADMLRKSKRTAKKAQGLEYTIVKDWERMGRKGQAKFKNDTDANARIRFQKADEVYEDYKKEKIEYPRSLTKQSISRFQKTLADKIKGKDKIKAVYTDVVKLGRPEWALASLFRIGDAHLHLVDAINKTPAPKGLTPEQADLFKEKLREKTFPIEEQAAEAFKLCYDKSVELNLFNTWTQKCLNFLEENRADQFPKIMEEFVVIEAEVPDPPANGLILAPPKRELKQKVIDKKKRTDEEDEKGEKGKKEKKKTQVQVSAPGDALTVGPRATQPEGV